MTPKAETRRTTPDLDELRAAVAALAEDATDLRVAVGVLARGERPASPGAY